MRSSRFDANKENRGILTRSDTRWLLWTFHELSHGVYHLAVLSSLLWIFHILVPDVAWSVCAVPVLLLALPFRYALLDHTVRGGEKEPWRGWLAADFLFLYAVLIYVAPPGPDAFICLGIVLMGASFRASPLLLARLAAAILIFYVIILWRIAVPEEADFVYWFRHLLMMSVFAWSAIGVSIHAARQRGSRVHLKNQLNGLFDRMRINLILLDGEGRIRMVNGRALHTLDRDEPELKGLKFSRFLAGNFGLNREPLQSGAHVGLMERRNGEQVQIVYELVPIDLPGGLFEGGSSAEFREYQLVVFSDVSEFIRDQELTNRRKRHETVKNMLEVFADGVRNPLAGISTYVQALDRLEEDSGDGSRRGIFKNIIHEITELDALLESLMNNARLSPGGVEARFDRLKRERQAANAADTVEAACR